MMSYILVFSFGLFSITFLSRNKTSFIKNLFYFIIANLYFVLITLLLPEGFADDQYEYFGYVKYDFDSLQLKYQIMKAASYIPYELFSFEMMEIRYLLYISFTVILLFILYELHINNYALLILVIMPSVFLHAGLFLREPISYIFIVFFIYSIIKKRFLFGILSFLVIFIVRPDSAGLLTPFFIFWLTSNKRIQFLFSTILVASYLILITSTPLEILLDGYRSLFGMPDFNINLQSIINSLLNLLFGSMLPEIATILMLFETIVTIVMMSQVKNKNILLTCWLIGLLIIGSISNNSGFVLRMRSPLLLITFIYFLFEKSTTNHEKK